MRSADATRSLREEDDHKNDKIDVVSSSGSVMVRMILSDLVSRIWSLDG